MRDLKPYNSKGTFKRFFIESDGNELKLTTSDIEGSSIDGNYLKLPKGYAIMNILPCFHNIEADTINQRLIDIRFTTDGCQEVMLPSVNNFDYGYMYLLVRKW